MGTYRRDIYTSKAASDITSETVWVGDAETLTLFLRGSPSTTSVQMSLADGRSAAIPETSWSDVTQITSPSPDLIDIEPGGRWLRTLRSETTEVVVSMQQPWGGVI